MSKRNDNIKWFHVSSGLVDIQDYLEAKFRIPPAFIEDEKKEYILIIPTFLSRDSDFKLVLDSSKKLSKHSGKFKGVQFSELVNVREEYRNQLEQVYIDIQEIYKIFADTLISNFKHKYENIKRKEQKRKDNLLFRIKSLLTRQLPSHEEIERKGLFLDELNTISDFFENVVHGADIPISLDSIGYFADKNFTKKLFRDPPTKLQNGFKEELKNIPEERQQQKRIDLFNKYDEELRIEYKEKLQKRLRMEITSITDSDALDLPLTYDRIKDLKESQTQIENVEKPGEYEITIYPLSLKKQVNNQFAIRKLRKDRKRLETAEKQNILCKLEKLRKKAFPLAINYLAIQRAINKSFDIDSLIDEFANWFAEKSKKGFSPTAIATLTKLYEQSSYINDKGEKDTIDDFTVIIKRAKQKNGELREKDPTYRTFENIRDNWNEFLTHAQQ